jgi:large exoprotein involved in heme utilization and adhesion
LPRIKLTRQSNDLHYLSFKAKNGIKKYKLFEVASGDTNPSFSPTFGQGNAGDISIQATDTVTFDGFDSDSYSSAFSNVEAGGVGNGGEINIKARSLSITNGGQLEASVSKAFETLPGGQGQGGNINIDVDDTLTIANGNQPRIFADLGTGAIGKGGNIDIQAENLIIRDGGYISSSTLGQGGSGNISITADNSISLDANSSIVNNVEDLNAIGDGGNIDITTGSLSATNGSQINSFTRGQGNAGDINIQASDTVTFDGSDGNDNYSTTSSNVQAGGEGNGGNLNIEAGSLSLTNGGYLEVSVREASDSLPGGQGKGGNVNISVDDALTIAGENALGIFARLDAGAIGSGGDINIQAANLVVKDGGNITASTLGKGDSGNITIQVSDTVTFDGSDGNDNYSSASSNVQAGGEGNGGNLNITARSLALTNGGFLSASVFGQTDTLSGGKGQGGNINIDVDNTLTIADGNRPGIFASLGTGAVGSGGKIDIQAGNLIIRDGGQLEASTFGQGNAGDITIQATDSVIFDGFDSDGYSSAFTRVGAGAVGNGGDINITARSLSLTNCSDPK